MNFADESYVRVYTRDTMTWKRLSWQARCVWSLLLRKLDRAGVLELEELAPVEAVTLVTELPLEVVEEGLPKLLERGVVELRDGVLIAPRFLEAQECTKSDALRAREYRDRRRSQVMSGPSQPVTAPSQPVTAPSREITERHAANESSRERHSTLRYADPTPPSAAPSDARARTREDWSEGLNWFCALLLGGDTTQAPDVGKWREDYAKLGRKPEAERIAAARTASADPYVQANRQALTPGHFVQHWGKYRSGGLKTPNRGPSGSEVAAAAREAAAGSKVQELRQAYAAQIRTAREKGDDYTANRLAAERDQRIAFVEAKAS